MKNYKDFFSGIYGMDTLSAALLFLALLLCGVGLTDAIPYGKYCGLLAWIPMILVILRGLSHDSESRLMENEKFLSLVTPSREILEEREEEKQQKKVFRFFHCPACRQKIRVPKGKGRVEITCPNCARKFIKKT